jgi:F-type H+-transporting ATPase subunit g
MIKFGSIESNIGPKSSAQTFQTYWTQALHQLRNPSGLLSSTAGSSRNVIATLRNLNAQQLAAAGIITAEVIGFFTVGEMLGRFKVVGYRSDAPAHHD